MVETVECAECEDKIKKPLPSETVKLGVAVMWSGTPVNLSLVFCDKDCANKWWKKAPKENLI